MFHFGAALLTLTPAAGTYELCNHLTLKPVYYTLQSLKLLYRVSWDVPVDGQQRNIRELVFLTSVAELELDQPDLI